MPRRSKYSSRAIERRNSSSVADGRFCTPCPSYEDIGDGEDIFTGENIMYTFFDYIMRKYKSHRTIPLTIVLMQILKGNTKKIR
jgi:hypothetical protein